MICFQQVKYGITRPTSPCPSAEKRPVCPECDEPMNVDVVDYRPYYRQLSEKRMEKSEEKK